MEQLQLEYGTESTAADIYAARQIIESKQTFIPLEKESLLDLKGMTDMIELLASLPLETKRRLSFHHRATPEQIDEGVDDGCMRDGTVSEESESKDTKDAWHGRLHRTRSLLETVMIYPDAREVITDQRFQRGLVAIEKALQKLRMRVQPVINAIDRELPEYGIQASFADPIAIDDTVMRIMRYLVTKNRPDVLAKMHIDRSALTIAVANTHPGLADKAGNLITIPENHIMLFPGRQLQQATGGEWYLDKSGEKPKWKVRGGIIQPFEHQVIAVDREENFRKAIIMFMKAAVSYWRN